jgi:hypothetical protein
MVDFLSFLVLIGLIGQSAIGLGYLVSSIWEQEKRASFFAGVQFLAMAGALILFIYWWASGFLATAAGIGIVICLLVGGIAVGIMLIRKTPVNQKALEGARGCITGDVKRFDERDVVFARNRTIRPGSEQFKAYYQMRGPAQYCSNFFFPGHCYALVSTGSLPTRSPPRIKRTAG